MPPRQAAALAALALAACTSGGSSPGPSPTPTPTPAPLLHVPSPAWEEQIVYFVMTDRFANGDRSNDDQRKGELDPTSKDKYSGGDLQGIIDKLDYIQGLGATAVWITPPVANMWWDPLQQSGGYHGYWARHLEKVDEHFGTLDTYKALSDALHKRGMYLIQDVVPNHMGNFFQYSSYPAACTPATSDAACAVGSAIPGCDPSIGLVKNLQAVPASKPEQAPFDQSDPSDPAQRAAGIYHWTPAISDYANACQEASYQISDLDDLDTGNPVVRAALKKSYGYWIKEVGVDAFRVDTAKFVPHDFWNDFFHSTDAAAPGILAQARATGRYRFHAFGEVYEIPDPMTDALERKVVSYLGTPARPELPAVLAFPLYGEIGRVFSGGKPTSYLGYRLGKLADPTIYPNPGAIPTFLDNHDVERFLSTGSLQGLQQALALLFTLPGIPVVYYGTEQRLTVPRAAMFAGGWGSGGVDRYDASAALYQKIRKLADLRKGSRVFTAGALEPLYDNQAGPGALAYRRTLGAESALVLMNTSPENTLVSQLDTRLPAGSVLEKLHAEGSPDTPLVAAGGLLTAVLPARSVLVLRPTGQVVTPPPPAATLTVNTAIDGQTFASDVAVTGTVSPVTNQVWMVLDGLYNQATNLPVAADGSWSATLPVSTFPEGPERHAVAFYAPGARVSTPLLRFTSNVVFTGQTLSVPDPVGDDKGPAGTYGYPTDATFGHQMDVTGVTLQAGATTLNVKIALADFSSVWNPPNGFDHVAFSVFLSLPGAPGATALPKLSASAPAGYSWDYGMFSYGWGSPILYSSSGATAADYGAIVTPAPAVKADAATKTVSFRFDRRVLGLASWSGVRVYVTTWDFDGIGAVFRPLCDTAGQWTMGGGTPAVPPATCPSGVGQASGDPKIMDDVPPIDIP